MKVMFKAVSVVTVFSMLLSLFGCKNKCDYTADDIKLFSISSGNMDLSQCYSFSISKQGDCWHFFAECTLLDGEKEIRLEAPIDTLEAKEILSIIEKNGLIDKYSENKRETKIFNVADETTYNSVITFSDGSCLSSSSFFGMELESAFKSLTKKYYNAP